MPDFELLSPRLFIGLQRSGPMPLYFQVATRIEKAIADGEIPPGSRLENEVSIAQRLGLSRPTIRRAIQELVDRGLLVRRRGVGTQVVQRPISRRVELTSLFEDLERNGQRPTTTVLTLEVLEAADTIAERLGQAPGSPVLHIRRLRTADKVPIAVLENYLPSAFVDLSLDDLSAVGLYQLMRARGSSIRVATQRIGAREASIEEGELLELGRHSPVLTMDRTAFDDAGAAVEYGHHCYRPDLYSFEMTLVEK